MELVLNTCGDKDNLKRNIVIVATANAPDSDDIGGIYGMCKALGAVTIEEDVQSWPQKRVPFFGGVIQPNFGISGTWDEV